MPLVSIKHILLWISVFVGLTVGLSTETCQARSIQDTEYLQTVILDHSSKSKVVMFGGKHGSYRADDDFVAQLLPKLNKQGFEYLALEFEKNPRKNSLHEIVQDYAHGKLIKEHIHIAWISREKRYCAGTFDLMDVAKNLGMNFIFYDADEGEYNSWKEREKISFSNLKELIFEKDPNAKAVIFCGASHINEEPYEDMSGDVRKGSQEKIRYLACYIDKGSNAHNFTVSLLGASVSGIIAPHCDMVVDLNDSTYYYNCHSQ